MTREQKAHRALENAEVNDNEIDRSLWLAKAADHLIAGRAVLVGGAAVNLYTGSYRPTDVDMCAYLDEADHQRLRRLGFEHRQGDHFAFTFSDGERWLIEFPDTQVDGEVMRLELKDDETLEVISLESLIVDRVLQATDGTEVTFDEAVRLCVAVFGQADWTRVEADVQERDQLEPGLRIARTYKKMVDTARSLLKG